MLLPIALNLIMLLLGMFIDPVAAIILFAPILATAPAAAGVDPVRFDAIAILNLDIGLLAPETLASRAVGLGDARRAGLRSGHESEILELKRLIEASAR